MSRLRPRKPSASMLIALIALMVALGGTSYAAVTLPANSVGTKQLTKNAVTTPKIKNRAVTAAKINPAGLTVPRATNAGNASTADGQTLTNVNVNVPESGSQQVYSANGLSVTVLCSPGGEPTINVNGPNHAELNWSGNNGGTTFGGRDANINNSPDDVTSTQGRGNGTFAASTFSPAHVLSGNLSWDDTPTHGSAFTGCSVWGSLISS